MNIKEFHSRGDGDYNIHMDNGGTLDYSYSPTWYGKNNHVIRGSIHIYASKMTAETLTEDSKILEIISYLKLIYPDIDFGIFNDEMLEYCFYFTDAKFKNSIFKEILKL